VRDGDGNAIVPGSNTPYSPRTTCSGATGDIVQFFGSPPVIGNAGCHSSIINGYGLSRNSGTCRVFDFTVPAWVPVSAATQDACNSVGGMWFPDLSTLYESGPATASKDHGAGTTPYAVPYPRHGISASYHFQQGRAAPWGSVQRNYYGLPDFTSSPGMFGGFHDLYNRGLAAPGETSPDRFDLGAYDFATSSCGWCHPGGGNMEYDREGFRYDGRGGMFQPGANPDPKRGDYYSFDPVTGTIMSKVADWQNGGSAEVDCLVCHTETRHGYSHLERNHALSEAKTPGRAASLGLAGPDGASGYLAIPRFGGDGINPDVSSMSWNVQNWFFSWLTWSTVSGMYLEDIAVVPPKEACAQCHFADGAPSSYGPAGKPLSYGVFQKVLPAGTTPDEDKVSPGGKNDADWAIFEGRSGTTAAAVSINDPNNADAHMDGGMNCSTCHYPLGAGRTYQDSCLVCHPDFYGGSPSDPVTPTSPQIFPAVTDQNGNVVQPAVEVFKIDHQFARGNSKPEGAHTDQFDNTVTCESCHLNGSHPRKGAAPNPALAHAAFPPFHFERIDCKTCHIPALNGPLRQSVTDFTVGPYQGGPRGALSESASGVAFTPLYVWRTKTHDGTGMHIEPVAAATVALWADGISWDASGSVQRFAPVLQRNAQSAAEAVRTSSGDSDGDGIFDWPLNRPQGGDSTLIVNTPAEIQAMVAELRARGVAEPVMILSFPQQVVSHNVAPKSSGRILGAPAGGGCVMCHSSSDPASPNYSVKSVGFFDRTYRLFEAPRDGGAGIVQTVVPLAGTTTPGKRVAAVFRAKTESGADRIIDLAGGDGSSVRSTLSQDELLGLSAYASPAVAGVPVPTAMFGYSRNGLSIALDASGSWCPSGNCSYTWNLGDGAPAAGITTSHTYAVAGTYTVTLTVLDNVNFTQAKKSAPISVVAADSPPTVGGTCTFDSNTWTATLTDASTDDNGITQVTVSWGDGTLVSSDTSAPFGPFTHTYANAGTYTITHKAIDTIGQQSTDTCAVTAPYFTITGTVLTSGTAPVPSATVQVKKGTSVVKTVYTAANGLFSAGSLRPGTYTLTVTKPGYTFAVPAATMNLGPSSAGTIIHAVSP